MKKLLHFRFIAMVGGFLLLSSFSSDKGRYYEIAKNLEIFTNLYKEVNTYYVDDLDPSELMRKGVDAMLASLDPYTNYISETDIEGYRYYTEGKFHGIGADVKDAGERLLVVSVIKDGPADKAGIVPGDVIVKIDGKPTQGKKADDLLSVFQGVPGTTFNLTVRKTDKSEKSLSITREDVDVKNVPYSGMLPNDIGYISLTVFSRNAASNIKKALNDLKSGHPDLKGLVLDLRGNGGGLLSEAVDIVNIFEPADQLVVTTKGKVIEWDRTYTTRGNPVDLEIPLAILTNKNSASASEIVSGSIQDLDRGVIIGQRTYGKGLVQNTKDLGYNSKVKLTTAKYYIPSKRCIQSVEYDDNGEPVHIPDDQRAVFYTKNGRPVLDGGGIAPDIKLEEKTNTPLLKALKKQFMIFDFVTELVQKGEKIDSLELYHFSRFNEFTDFLKRKNFSYETDSEKLLKQLSEKGRNDGLEGSFSSHIQAMEQSIQQKKDQEIAQNKAVIISEIEKEVASRIQNVKGKVKMSLRNDDEVKKAIEILNDQTQYQKILKGK
ncbi:MAG TPA: S41 family peptidase [Saprospiraceae bacterium]|nr:S41 family peptidase [Saprospiraceae bacterium]